MNEEIKNELEDELREEYDLSQLTGQVRGKYVERYRQGTNLVLLDPDVAKEFPTHESVNQALRLLIRLAKSQVVK
ncbi:hypothetical protein C7H19_18385 [Aphanothece hegewaldii CCALA 016]|uniref:Uncharacterized protein n=1 Tax=Aphanothece hegewaldii CCALA 016 TaxID=2107694 RepID=A0A2T1LTT9_9CHRO|nr:hypothetical protein [Aphanothece hegewaldii]PSF34536.1 hypothetical protein C7H19_18385 [Aphanothece hegewaldii CCALA 016]